MPWHKNITLCVARQTKKITLCVISATSMCKSHGTYFMISQFISSAIILKVKHSL
nr:MAG TPA: hypothetical protein [Caudoviricetes sp.]